MEERDGGGWVHLMILYRIKPAVCQSDMPPPSAGRCEGGKKAATVVTRIVARELADGR